MRLVAIWADAIYSEVGKPPVRGFGGRFYFYDQSNQAVPVEGQLAVYAYDDSVEGVPANAASMKYVFTADQFAQHHSITELGDSYSIWLPWESAQVPPAARHLGARQSAQAACRAGPRCATSVQVLPAGRDLGARQSA